MDTYVHAYMHVCIREPLPGLKVVRRAATYRMYVGGLWTAAALIASGAVRCAAWHV